MRASTSEVPVYIKISSNRSLLLKMASTISRPSANFAPSMWGSTFSSFTFPHSEFESYCEQVEAMKEDVKDMLMASAIDPAQNIHFINTLCRLGVSYHFEKEIEEQLNNIFSNIAKLFEDNNFDLFTTSLLFRILRQHGFKMSCDVFNKFKDSEGKFNRITVDDVRGILSLYEASYLSVHGEDIMEEALSFTRKNLENSLALPLSPHLAKHIKNTLNLPFHKSISRIEARKYIPFYEEEEPRNQTLLKVAKLDFNRVQLLLRQELATFAEWWEEINLREKLPYARDRMAEVYLWTVGCQFEPENAISRRVLSKCIAMISALDDTFDAHGTLLELQLFVDALERWSFDAIDELPDYMKFLYKTLLDVVNEAEDLASGKGKAYGGYYLKEGFKELVRTYYQEKKWGTEHFVPSVDEYLKNGYGTSTYGVFLPASFIGMEAAGTEEFEWYLTNPKIVRGLKIVGRVKNDIVTHKEELLRGDCASSVECYMKECGVSEEKAIEEMQRMCEDVWKDVNEECMKPTSVPLPVLKYIIDLLRTTEVFYRHIDGYTKSAIMKDAVISLFAEKIEI